MMDEEAKLVERYGRERPFKVPQEYFSQLSERVLSQTSRKPKVRVVKLWTRKRVGIAAAACVCVLVGLGYGLLLYNASSQETTPVAMNKPTITMPVIPVSNSEESVSTASVAGSLTKAVKILAEPITKENKNTKKVKKSEIPQSPHQENSKTDIAEQETMQADALEEALDYLMMDAEDLYAMLDEE